MNIFFTRILGLLFGVIFTIGLSAQCSNSGAIDWSVLNWPSGTTNNDYDITVGGETVNVDITISKASTAAWGCQGAPREDNPNWFGTAANDLRVCLTPGNGNQGTATITVVFDKTVSGVYFEIADIDHQPDEPGAPGHTDVVSITSDGGNPTLSYKNSANASSYTISGNTATANLKESIADDNGTVEVDFGTTEMNNLTITYTEASNNTDGRGIAVLGDFEICFDNLLPVDMVSFETKVKEENNVMLEWVTASEQNNEYFSVEMSVDGLNFNEFGRVTGSGFSNKLNTYNYETDYLPGGVYYFRIGQVDFDGTKRYSDIRSVQIENRFDKLVAYPNPSFGSEITISGIKDDLTNSSIDLIDMNGRSHRKNLSVNGNQIKINPSDLVPGMYIVSVNSERLPLIITR